MTRKIQSDFDLQTLATRTPAANIGLASYRKPLINRGMLCLIASPVSQLNSCTGATVLCQEIPHKRTAAKRKTYIILFALILAFSLSPGIINAQVTGDSLCLKLRMAAWEGNYDTLRAILDTTETDIDCYAPYEINALGYAIEEGHYEIVELLLSFGADPNKRQNGMRHLDRAVIRQLHDIAELLILYGADPNNRSNTWITPLIRAVNIGDHIMIDMLLHYGANPDLALNDSTTPLLLSVMYSDYEAAALLAGYGADVNKADKNGFTPLMISAWLNDTAMALWLLELGARTEPVNYQGRDALSVAIGVSATEMVKILLPLSSTIKPRVISNLAIISKNKSVINLTESYGYKSGLRPVLVSRHFSYGLMFNRRHLMGTYSYGVRDVRYNTLLSVGFLHRYKPATIFHTLSGNDSIVYQLQGKRYMIFASLDKLFVMFENKKHSLSLSAGMQTGYSWGSFKGTGMKPRQGFTLGIKGGVVWETKNFSLGVYYQQMQFSESPIPKEHIVTETSLVFPLKRYTVTPKKMPYVFTI